LHGTTIAGDEIPNVIDEIPTWRSPQPSRKA
jgi:hypothetical protein